MAVISFPVNLSILLHGVISLPDATSYDKRIYHECEGRIENPSRGSLFGITRLAE